MVVGEFTRETNLVVIGSGPGGYTAALRAAELGVETLIADPMGSRGGACLHHWCIPGKAILGVGEAIRRAEHAAQFGVQFTKPTVDLAKVRQWMRQTIDALAAELDETCQERGVEIIKGIARFEGPRQITIKDGATSRIRFKRAVIATGSGPQPPAGGWPASARVMDPAAALRLEHVPETLLVIGGGSIGLELASAYAALGSAVTLITREDRLLTAADHDLVQPLAEELGRTLEEIRLATTVDEIRAVADGVQAHYGGDGAVTRRVFDRVLVATGQRPNTDGLELNRARVELDDHGAVRVDNQLRTSNPRVFAVGDVTGAPHLAGRAMYQGKVAAEVIAGRDSVFDARAVPFVLFTDPQIAWCGVTEHQAKAACIPHLVRKVAWGAAGRAASMGRGDGTTKLIIAPDTGLLLGMGMVGTGAGEMIAQGVLALEMGAVATDLASTIRPYPTLSGLISEAAQRAEMGEGPP
ncbi:MAG: dihydrolipoyl dehydrogenase family protein [Planctomycetota bacterium]|jgi:dihydrolipoamide dehydrogenase